MLCKGTKLTTHPVGVIATNNFILAETRQLNMMAKKY